MARYESKSDMLLNDLEILDPQKVIAAERNKEISSLVGSINELAVLFKDLSVLVIDQGTIIDRIDYNVESTLRNVRKGNEQLVEARKASESMRAKSCIMCLVSSIVLCVIILFLKHHH